MSESALKMVVGLGNPGTKYEKTRHNIGFDCLTSLWETMAAQAGMASQGGAGLQSKFESQMVKGRLDQHEVVLVWPLTYMNCSGRAVSQVAKFYKIPIGNILVVCDDLSLPLGKLRMRKSGSSGGQKGLEDILKSLGSQDVPRLRIGIDPTPENAQTVDYVLSKFSKQEREIVDESLARAVQAIRCWLGDGIDVAMNKFNTERVNPEIRKPKQDT